MAFTNWRRISTMPSVVASRMGLCVALASSTWKAWWYLVRSSKLPALCISSAMATLRSSSARSSAVMFSQAMRITAELIEMRAAVRWSGVIAPRKYRSRMPLTTALELPGNTKAPPAEPSLSSIRPLNSSARRASRMVLRLTPNIWARSRSGGSLSPGRSLPSEMLRRNWLATSW